MQKRISALIIDPHQKDHDYALVNTENDYEYRQPYGENGFDITVMSDTDKILTAINKARGVDCIVTIGSPDEINMEPLNDLSFEFRKKWIHCEEFNPPILARNIIDVFVNNINRGRDGETRLFSIFTCTFNTSKDMFERLYNSLKYQTYHNWNWFILDDSTNPATSEMIEHYHDPRITIIKNVSNHGCIGFNKHVIASICDGDYLIEVDHDDELTFDCLEELNNAINKYPDSDFLYSHAIEEVNGYPVDYGDQFAYGLGTYRDFDVAGYGLIKHVAATADINAISLRGIHALPNHLRCWRKEFYHKIGGHNTDLSVMDDMDILIRTFLAGGVFTKVDNVLYIQHEGKSDDRKNGPTTTSARFYEIQRMNELLKGSMTKKYTMRFLA